MFAYIEEFSGNSYVAQIEQNSDYRPIGGLDPKYAMRLVGEPIVLKLYWYDEPLVRAVRSREVVGTIAKPGYPSNRCVEITEDEYIALLEANSKYIASELEKVEAKEETTIRALLEQAEKQADIPSPEEARKRRIAYNNLYNEGGEGYVPQPHIIDSLEYERLKKRLAALTEKRRKREEKSRLTVKEIRAAAKLTQAELAARFGIPLRTVQNWESRDSCPDYVRGMMAELLNIKVKEGGSNE